MRPRRPYYWFVLGLLGSAVWAAEATNDKEVADELKRHQGTWIATSSTFDGQKAPEDVVRSIKRIVSDDHVVWEAMADALPEQRSSLIRKKSRRQST